MALQPYRDEDLNFFKFASLVLDEFPKALRQTFKTMWDNTYGHRPSFQVWDDSNTVRNLFATAEGGKTNVPVHQSYHEWDCSALFQATIYSRAFALPHGTLKDVYLKRHRSSHGRFHPTVVTGNNEETCALAIDQLRLLRNSLCHSTSSKITKAIFDQYVKHAKDAFQALGVSTALLDAVGSLSESDFPTNEVRRLEQGMKEESKSYKKFLERVNFDISDLKKKMESDIADKEDVVMLSRKMDELKDVVQDEAEGDLATKDDVAMLSRIMEELKNVVQDEAEGDLATKDDVAMLSRIMEELKNVVQDEAEGDLATKDDVAMLARKIDELRATKGTSDNKEDTNMSADKEGELKSVREKYA